MFLKITKCDYFYLAWQYISTFADQIVMVCDENGLDLKVMTAGHNGLASIGFPASYFDEYNCEKKMDIGLVSKDFVSVLKSCYKKDVILKIHAENNDEIHVSIEDEESKYVCAYTLKCTCVEGPEFEIPEIEYDAVYDISTETLKKWRDLLYDKDLSFTPMKKQILIESYDDGDDAASNRVKLTGHVQPTEFRKKKWKKQTLISSHAKNVYSLLPFGKNIKFLFKNNGEQPIHVSVDLNEGVILHSFFAAKTEDEDEEDKPAEVKKKRKKNPKSTTPKRQKTVEAN